MQVIENILKMISSGQVKEHDKLPSERELCDIYGISRTTLRQAMVELENKGYIYKEHGKGSFVAPATFKQSLTNIYSFSEEMKRLGKKTSTDILSFQIMKAPSRIAKVLQIEEEAEVIELIRLRYADQEPIVHETCYLPRAWFADLTQADLEGRSLYDVLREKYQITINRAFESIQAIGIKKPESTLLHESEGAPGLRNERIGYAGEQIVECTIAISPGDKFTYTVELT